MGNSKGFYSHEYNLEVELFCLPKKYIFNNTGNSWVKTGLILPTENIIWLMAVAFVCVSKAWFHSFTGKAHSSQVLKNIFLLSERTFWFALKYCWMAYKDRLCRAFLCPHICDKLKTHSRVKLLILIDVTCFHF